jgi:hypothetical protein
MIDPMNSFLFEGESSRRDQTGRKKPMKILIDADGCPVVDITVLTGGSAGFRA